MYRKQKQLFRPRLEFLEHRWSLSSTDLLNGILSGQSDDVIAVRENSGLDVADRSDAHETQSFAESVYIRYVIAEAFGAGATAFRDLPTIGDMNEKLRSSTELIDRYLDADHFDGRHERETSQFHW